MTVREDVHPANLALIDRFEVWEHKRNLVWKTIQGRRMRLQSLAHHLGKSLLEATADDIDDWLRSRNQPAGLAPQTFEAYLRMVRAFYQWALRERLIDKDPTGDVVRPRLPRPLPRPMDPGDLVRAIEAADDRKAAMLALAAYAGLRCHEIAALRIEEVDFQRKRLLVVKGKGGRDRVIPLHPEVEKRLRRIEPKSGYVFHRVWPHPSPQPIRPGTVSQILSEYLRGQRRRRRSSCWPACSGWCSATADTRFPEMGASVVAGFPGAAEDALRQLSQSARRRMAEGGRGWTSDHTFDLAEASVLRGT